MCLSLENLPAVLKCAVQCGIVWHRAQKLQNFAQLSSSVIDQSLILEYIYREVVVGEPGVE